MRKNPISGNAPGLPEQDKEDGGAFLERFETALDQMNADQLWQLAAMCEASGEGLEAMADPLRRLALIREAEAT